MRKYRIKAYQKSYKGEQKIINDKYYGILKLQTRYIAQYKSNHPIISFFTKWKNLDKYDSGYTDITFAENDINNDKVCESAKEKNKTVYIKIY